MKKYMLAACFALVAVAAIPASASAFAGTCEIQGNATIYKAGSFTEEQALPLETSAPRNYKFNSTEGKCVGTGAGEFNAAEVKGEGELACAVSKGGSVLLGSGKGSGFIEINKVRREIAKFGFTASTAALAFESEGPFVKGLGGTGPATGAASFAKNSTAVTECVKGEAKKLHFEAATTGEFS
jgi:hypothetical protein